MENLEINPKGTVIARAAELDAYYGSFIFKLFFFVFWIAGVVAIGGIIANYFLGVEQENQILGIMFVISGVFLFYVANRYFYLSKVKNPKVVSLKDEGDKIAKGTKVNIFEIFSFELAKATRKLFLAPKENWNTKNLILAILASRDMSFMLLRLGISSSDLNALLGGDKGATDINKVMKRALEIAVFENHNQIEIGDVFVALSETDPALIGFIRDLKLNSEDIANVVYWQTSIYEDINKRKGFLNPERLRLTGGVGKDWAFGWTPFLRQYSQDISKSIQAQGLNLEIIGHDNEIKQIKEALSRQNGGNAVVVGEPGVGKKTTVLGFTKAVLEGKTNSALDFKHVVKIDVDYIMSGLQSPGEATERISGVLSEAASAGNIVVYFENFQDLLSSGDAGKIDASEVLLPFLDSPEMHIVATCDIQSFNKYILGNGALSQRFTRVDVEEPDKKEMVRILEDVVPTLEYSTKSLISYEAIKEAIEAGGKYILNVPNPEKSINLLDGTATQAVSERGKTIILAKDVLAYVSEKYDVPTGEVEGEEKTKLLQLEKIMHQSVIGQEEAIAAISNALRRSRAGVVDSKKPIGSFLFLGPTGVGKTETAKALARAYFGAADRMIRFDMSEYQNKEDIYRFIGSNIKGEDVLGALTTAVRESPFSLLLFDEIEKAHKDILDLFLQMLDEGIITDGSGRKVSFMNTIIICTSNAGANLIRESITNGIDYENTKKHLLEYIQSENIYRPEFLNRFTSVVAFSPLSQGEIGQVAALLITNLRAVLKKNKGINVTVAPDAVGVLALQGFDPQMGARPMQRVIQEKLENLLANKILSGELKTGDSITITAADVSA